MTSIDGLVSRLSETFQISFVGWSKQAGEWRCAEHGVSLPSQSYAAWLDLVSQAEFGSPIVERQSNGQLWIGIGATSDPTNPTVLAGQTSDDSMPAGERLVNCASNVAGLEERVAEQRLLLDDYAGKLTASYEELSFFRQLAHHVEYCEATRDLAEVAEGVLPALCQIAQLEGLALFLATDGKAEKLVARLGTHSGSIQATEASWLEVLENIVQSDPGLVVQNFDGFAKRQGEKSPLPGVVSLVVAPIVKHGITFGWLVGVNKLHDDAAKGDDQTSLGHDQIGTAEASLLQAVTVMLATHAANVRLLHEKEQLVVDVIHTLVGVIEARDAYTCGHSDRVALVARRIAQQLGMDPQSCQQVYLAGLLHDIGKVGVADDVLQCPTRLTDEQFEQIKLHPTRGWQLLRRFEPLKDLLPGVLHHHESMDGSGYPGGLAGEEIPLLARILAVADAYDAMTSNRPYRDGMPTEKAESILRDGAGTQWDTELVDAFFAVKPDVLNITRQWKDHLRAILGDTNSTSQEELVGYPTAPLLAMDFDLAPLATSGC